MIPRASENRWFIELMKEESIALLLQKSIPEYHIKTKQSFSQIKFSGTWREIQEKIKV